MTLPKNLQAQLLCNYISDVPTRAAAGDFSEPYAACWQAIQGVTERGKRIEALEAALNVRQRPENTAIIAEILALKPKTEHEALSMAEQKDSIHPVEWVWPGFIPKNYITVLGAIQGSGKTALMQDLARRITTPGETWPDGQPIAKYGRVLYIDGEGMPEGIKERAEQWQMNLKDFYYCYPKNGEIYDLGSDKYKNILLQAVYEVRPLLLFVDSLGSINSKGENNVEDLRGIFAFLTGLARDFELGLILSHHLRKRFGALLEGTEMTLDDFRGSGHITQMARSVLAMSIIRTGPEIDRNGPRRLEVVKSNLGPYPAPLGLEFVAGFPSGFVLKWGDSPKTYHEPDKSDLVAEWLKEVLADGPASLAELVRLGELEGFSKATIHRTRKRLGSLISDTKGSKDPENKWQILEKPNFGS